MTGAYDRMVAKRRAEKGGKTTNDKPKHSLK
jgi:hypothetical protein